MYAVMQAKQQELEIVMQKGSPEGPDVRVVFRDIGADFNQPALWVSSYKWEGGECYNNTYITPPRAMASSENNPGWERPERQRWANDYQVLSTIYGLYHGSEGRFVPNAWLLQSSGKG